MIENATINSIQTQDKTHTHPQTHTVYNLIADPCSVRNCANICVH